MRILLISSLYGATGGGAGLIAHYLARDLKKAGHDISVITLGGDRHYSLADDSGIRVYRFQPRNLYSLDEKDTHPLWQKILWQTVDIYNPHAGRVLREILERESPDIVHIHKMRGFSGSVWSVAAKLFPGKVIQTCHDYESMSPDGLLRGAVGKMALEQKWPVRGYQLVRARLSRGVSLVTAPSRFTLQRIVESGLFPGARGRVIANTHGWSEQELRSFSQAEQTRFTDKVRFLFLGRLEAEKGIRELCQAFLRALDEEPGMELEIAGWGMLESELREQYGRHPGIKFLGVVDGILKMDVLRRATAVVVPSLVSEVFGLVTVEAYAFGKPVIASNAGGLPELVRHGETGWLVEPGDIEALSAQLRAVARLDPSMMTRMTQVCRDCSYNFSAERILAEYLELYDELSK